MSFESSIILQDIYLSVKYLLIQNILLFFFLEFFLNVDSLNLTFFLGLLCGESASEYEALGSYFFRTPLGFVGVCTSC